MTEPAPYQGMSLAVITELLGYIQAFDKNFVPDELDVRAYHVVAQDHRWTHHEATVAIRKWGGEHPEGQRMDPALLNRLIRDARQDRSMRAAAAPRPTTAQTGYSLDPKGWMEAFVHSGMMGRKLNQQIRAAVAQYPDLVEKFAEPPMEIDFDSWTGWYPPNATSFGAPNDSPRAKKIRDIAEEALERSGLRRQWREEQRDRLAADLAAFQAEEAK